MAIIKAGYKDYQEYKKWFKFFSTPEGYYEACDYLAFRDTPWLELNKYEKEIAENIKKVRGVKKKPLVGADICCGRRRWLARCFSELFNEIFCVDLRKESFKKPLMSLNRNCKVKNIVEDAAKVKFSKKVDFLYCGFNVYSFFIENLLAQVKDRGRVFLMKPKTGDDITLRVMFKNYNIQERLEEINKVYCLLKKYSHKLIYKEFEHHWLFPFKTLNTSLAGLSVVSMGGAPFLLNTKNYESTVRFIKERVYNETIVITQTISIWIVIM